MFKQLILNSRADAFAIASLFIFLAVFLFFLVKALRMKRSHLQQLSQLPLDDNSTRSPQS